MRSGDPRFTRAELLRRAAGAGALVALPGALTACGARRTRATFRAAAPGAVPHSGRPTVSGITLPPGKSWAPDWPNGSGPADPPVAWVTDGGHREAFDLARRLAKEF